MNNNPESPGLGSNYSLYYCIENATQNKNTQHRKNEFLKWNMFYQQ